MVRAVIGSLFGDEGKGSTTDLLSSPSSLTVRYNGGQQAGHTVVKDGVRHVFANFGSGTLSGSHTYWSRHCTIDPFKMLNELDVLKEKGITPTLYIDERCQITTPFDMEHNRNQEKTNKHGSCGVGFGSTIQRCEDGYDLSFMDMYYPRIFEHKIKEVQNYYNAKVTSSDHPLLEWAQACADVVSESCIIKVSGLWEAKYLSNAKELVFEGAQGLLLDQHHGFFPNVTRSNSGTKNILSIINEYNTNRNIESVSKNIDVHLITRAYLTRHGNGFMPERNHNIKSDPNETNVTNKYQGEFRRSIMDLDLIEYAIQKDDYLKNMSNTLVITCLDHIEDDYSFVHKGQVFRCVTADDFIKRIAKRLKMRKVITNDSPESKNFKVNLF